MVKHSALGNYNKFYSGNYFVLSMILMPFFFNSASFPLRPSAATLSIIRLRRIAALFGELLAVGDGNF